MCLFALKISKLLRQNKFVYRFNLTIQLRHFMTNFVPNEKQIMSKTSEIQLKVFLDESNIPANITWFASDSQMTEPESCKAFMLSVFDEKSSESLRIDLWTKEMRQDEMDKFFFETFMTMADTYHRANQNEELVKEMKDFAFNFGEKTGIIKRK